MKYHLLLFLLLVAGAFPACETPAGESEAAGAETNPTFVTLTDDQMELAGVELGRPERRQVARYVDCTGMIEVPPESLFSVYSPVNGFVNNVKHLPGDYVRKGELLTTVRHPDLVRLQRELLETKSRLRFLQEEYQRKDTLAGADAASRKALGQARSDYETARATYQGLKAELEMIGIDPARLEKDGAIQPAIPIRAPGNGYLTQVNVNPGKLITPDQLLYEIVDNNHLHLELQVFAKDLPLLAKGQRIECQAPGIDQTFHAEVYLLGKMIDPATKTTRVHGHFDEEPVNLTPGTYVQARIHTDAQEVTALPEAAIVRDGEQSFVFVKTPDGFRRMAIQTGLANQGYVQVETLELSDSELLAVKGAYYLQGMEGEGE